jgi:D-sedoheptulose 7-phosphate isomerase
MIKKRKFNFSKYFSTISDKFSPDNLLIRDLLILKKKILLCKKRKKKVIIFGNGGSSAIASHFALDLTNVTKIRCVNFSDASLITCLSNDYGFDNWICKALELYADNDDLLILISSSGMSKNMINVIKKSKIKFSSIITFTGFDKKNNLKKIGDLSFYVDSNVYNVVENVHQIWLLSIIDSLAENIK